MSKQSRDIELEKKIDAYVKGRLDEEQAQQLWEKLLMRPDYIELMKTELGIKTILERRAQNPGSPGDYGNSSRVNEKTNVYSLGKSWKWIAAAAAVVILLVSTNILQLSTSQGWENLALKDINLAENLASAPILRSIDKQQTPADSLLNRGFQAAISGNIDQAFEIYDMIIENYRDYPAAIQAHLNKGIIQYNAGQFENAAASFKKVIQNVDRELVLQEKAYWYLGHAYINLQAGKEEAVKAIKKAYDFEGIYHKPALRMLQKLGYDSLDDLGRQIEGGK